MHKKAIILDLDNTIYPVPSIGDELFAPLFKMIEENGSHTKNIDSIKDNLMRRPFQYVARDFQFGKELTKKGEDLLQELTYNGKIQPFEDYQFVKELLIDKFLVTTGFPKLQQSKITGMKITPDFKEIHIVDPSTTDRTKKDVFAEIMERHHYQPADVLVVGDDLHAEIRAAQESAMVAILYDPYKMNTAVTHMGRIESFYELGRFMTNATTKQTIV